MELVLKGGHSYIYSEYYSKTMVATRYTDKLGYTPIHISATEYPLFAGNAWAFRKVAPFLRRLDLAIQRLLEAGLIKYWMDDVISTRVRNTRRQQQEEEAGKNQEKDDNTIYQNDGEQVVLGLHHLQVTFYFLVFGYAIGLLTFLLEYLIYTLC
ncbi:hypothetical protein Hamer_G006115 [Homarus americanus]|uniref:Uncharacterized protein n=2 Tax=Homarus americanus TaxID=6706 RepID=A0A8J5JL20_HOMAM|nr:hypothetical protein Hamer_G006115 [Homarus americanus]